MYPFGGVAFNNVNLVKRVHESDRPCQFVFLVRHPGLYELTSLRQKTSVQLGMILLLTQKIELSVQHDDDK